MELNEILSLVKAGFTRDEIMQMVQPTVQNPNPEPVQPPVDTPAPTTEPQPAPTQVVEPVAVPAPAPAPVPQPAPQEAQPTMAELMQSIAKLTSAVQANAISQSVIPQGLQTPPSAEDMLAEIIRPTFTERS